MSGCAQSSEARRPRPLRLTALSIVAAATVLGPFVGGALFELCAILAHLTSSRNTPFESLVELSFLPATFTMRGLIIGALPAAIGGVIYVIADLLAAARMPRALVAAAIGAAAAAGLDVDFYGHPTLKESYWNVARLGAIGAAAAIVCAAMGRRVGLTTQMPPAAGGSPPTPAREER